MNADFQIQLNFLGWHTFVEEGSIMGQKTLKDRRLLIDLTDVERCLFHGARFAQLHMYLSFGILNHVEEVILRPLALVSHSPQHLRHHLSVSYNAQWRSELEASLSRAEDWARSVDLSELLDRMAVERPDRPSNAQINHLVALAFKGQFDVLEDYSAIFERGERFNFVPMITKAVIDAALNVAYDRYAEETEQGVTPNA